MSRDGMLSEKEVAAELGLSVDTLRRWRRNGGGPKSFTLGRSIRYRSEDIGAWLSARGMKRRGRGTAHAKG